MKIIDRQILLSVFLTMLFSVFVISPFLIMGNVFRDLLDMMINHRLPLRYVFQFMALAGIFTLTYTVPWGFLIAQLLVFGRMSADNELLTLKASGVSILRVCLPVFALAVLLSGFCFWINASIAPAAKRKVGSLLRELALSDPGSLFEAQSVIDRFPNSRIYVDGSDGNTLTNVLIFEIDDEGRLVRSIVAREAELTNDGTPDGLMLQFRSARFQERNRNDPADVTKFLPGMVIAEGSYPLPLDQLVGAPRKSRKMSDYTLFELKDFIAEGANGELLKARVEYAQRFSLALACLTFTMIGIPMGITTHRKESSVGFGLSLVIAFSYFFYVIVAREFSNIPQVFPVLIMWSPNFIIGGLGVILFVRLLRN